MVMKFWKTNKGFIIGILLMLFFRSAIADWYKVPTGSMQPNILIGDRVWVNKLAYDVKVPFSNINLSRNAEPIVGDIVVFQSVKASERLIKRVIGVPGDKISMVNNRLIVNGQLVQIDEFQNNQVIEHFIHDNEQASYFTEKHPGLSKGNTGEGSHTHTQGMDNKGYAVRLLKYFNNRLSTFKEIEVPPNHYWVMGDNRDNSADSRVIGLIPREELIGRAERVVVSLDKNNYYLPREGRFWEKL
ncbi:signal peptidase I [Aliikangiella sp. IMCC44359]|uniref:signal peptidase I n=1 Tax=Aliikangiella sp. IMCC44359 TaxID=3459125 RepID=UPI00403ADF35